MIAPATLETLIATDRLAQTQTAIVRRIGELITGVSVVAHPGKVDISELVARTVVQAPGVGIGFTRIRETAMVDGAFCLAVEWVAYVVAEACVVARRRVEKEAVGLAIGSRLLAILGDMETSTWGLTGILPPETSPQPELKPMFTVRDQAQGTVYYAVTWTQVIADLGAPILPDAAGTYGEASGLIIYDTAADLDEIARWVPARQVPDSDDSEAGDA
ncbi:hypothetical protein GWI72_00845 [Microvirga tunisiensis]|uniref:Uncharacterized protein n=1 Tax=Pannonibacter tanglangensis TaxID=2750084 RepID=A0A7X5F124_9HYPH|nr:hypothetical protein [Pannonibacter sp. XCT-53]NBN76810.1 hypothetical protein [Pannonibacter sp. XCT-53]